MLVRSAEKARDLKGAKLIVGNARDERAFGQALKGRDAVISTLGTPASPLREVTLPSSATQALVSARKAAQVSRLVCITGIGAVDSVGHGGFLFEKLIFPLLLRKVFAGRNRQETIIRDSRLDWILVRPSILNNKPVIRHPQTEGCASGMQTRALRCFVDLLLWTMECEATGRQHGSPLPTIHRGGAS